MGDVDVSYGEILIIDTYDTNAANIELANISQSVSAYATGSPGSVLYSPLIGISAETFYFSNNVFITNDLTISGSIFFNSLVVSGDSIFQSNLNIVKDCSINSNLYVDKVTTLEERVNINGPLLTSGTVTFQGDHTHTIEDSIEVGNLPGAAPGVAIGPTPRADSQILLDSSYGNIFATGYLQVNETTAIGKLGSLVNDCRIAHIDHSTDNYAFQQSLLGITSINAVDGRYITFDISQNEKIRIDSSGNTHFNSSDPSYVAIDISATSGIKLPKGTTSERPEGNPDISGIIRYNTETQQFEGYATAWQGLGGVIDVNQDTKIMAEDYPTADNNELRFYTKNIERMKVDASGTIQMMIYDENYIALDISATTGIMLPKGNTAQRPVAGGRDTSIREDISGVIRYNTETQQFEGYATAWQGLGGVIDVNQDTKILAEDYPTADNNELKFFTAGTPRMIIKSDGKVDISENVHLDKRLDVSGATVLDSTLNVTGATVLDSTLNVTGDAVFGGQIHGPSTLYIDPSVVGDDTGLVIVKGNLQVDGTTTTINSTTVDISDLTIKLAANSTSAASSNGAGIEVEYGGSILYKDPDNVWEFNRGVSITSGTLEVTESIDCGSSGTFADTLICSKDGTGLYVSKDATIVGTLTLPDGDVQTQIDSKQATLTFGKVSGNALKSEEDLATNNVLLMGASHVKGRTYAELKSDLTLNSVENTAVSTWAGSSNITTLGTISTGVWNGSAISNTYISSASTWNGKQDALTFGIGNTNVIKCGTDIVDNDFLRVNGTTLEGRSASELLSDIGAQATLTFGIGNTNVIKCGSGIVDDDFLRVSGTTLEGRSASELLSDIGAQATLTFGIGNTNVIKCGSGIVDDDFLRVSGTTLEGRSASELLSDIGAQATLTFGIGNTNVIKCGSGIVDDDFLRVSGTTLEGRSASELLSDIGAQATLTSLSDIQIQSLGVGTAASGTTGEIRATNNITAYYSDERLKDFMGTIPDALEKINKLNGYYFKENELAKSLGYSNERLQIGVSAQEVEKILPEIVTEAPIDSKYKTVWYEKLVPLLIEAIKELTEKVRILEEKLLSCN